MRKIVKIPNELMWIESFFSNKVKLLQPLLLQLTDN